MNSEPSSQPIGAAEAAEAAIAKIYQLQTEEDSQEPLQIIQQLLEPWKESSSNLLQPAALEKLDDSLVMSVLIAKGWDNLLELLLSLGLQIRDAQMSAAIHRAKKVKRFGALAILFKSVWDINRPLNNSCPPAIRYVVLRDQQYSHPGLAGGTLITLSLLLEHSNFVRLCLSMGASPNASSLSGHTVMQRAVAYAPLSTIQLLVKHGAVIKDSNLLPHAVLAYIDTAGEPGMPCRAEVIQYLIEHGASIDACYNDTLNSEVESGEWVYYGIMSALHFAIVGGKYELVGALLQNGADPRSETRSGWKTEWKLISSIELAKLCGFEDIASLLVAWKLRNDIARGHGE